MIFHKNLVFVFQQHKKVLKDHCAEVVPKQEAGPVLMIFEAKQARNGNCPYSTHTERAP